MKLIQMIIRREAALSYEHASMTREMDQALQTLRDRRLIGYSQINRRFYYKPEEVKRLIPLVGTLYPHGR